MAIRKRKKEYTVLGWVIQDPNLSRSYFMAWVINETGRFPIYSTSIWEYRIFKSEKQANQFNQILKGRISRIEIWG